MAVILYKKWLSIVSAILRFRNWECFHICVCTAIYSHVLSEECGEGHNNTRDSIWSKSLLVAPRGLVFSCTSISYRHTRGTKNTLKYFTTVKRGPCVRAWNRKTPGIHDLWFTGLSRVVSSFATFSKTQTQNKCEDKVIFVNWTCAELQWKACHAVYIQFNKYMYFRHCHRRLCYQKYPFSKTFPVPPTLKIKTIFYLTTSGSYLVLPCARWAIQHY